MALDAAGANSGTALDVRNEVEGVCIAVGNRPAL